MRWCLEGNIGSGKTTLGMLLLALAIAIFRKEPVDAWRGGAKQNLLAAFYDDPERWGLAFQLRALLTRAELWRTCEQEAADRPVVFERSVWSDHRIFAVNGLNSGYLKQWEYDLYCDVWKLVVAPLPEPHGYIYLRTPAEVCLERIRRRGRPEEANITLEYLRRIEMLHEEWLGSLPNVAMLDGTRYPTYEEIAEALKGAGMFLPEDKCWETAS
jgi:deoxyadenosine/deoxycytidine kinase